jgi:hypothetical protein
MGNLVFRWGSVARMTTTSAPASEYFYRIIDLPGRALQILAAKGVRLATCDRASRQTSAPSYSSSQAGRIEAILAKAVCKTTIRRKLPSQSHW